MYTSHIIYIHNICVHHITVMFIVVAIIIYHYQFYFILNFLVSSKFCFYQFRKEHFYPIKTEDQCTFIRETILHYHDWRKTEIDESDFIEYVKRHSKAGKKSGWMI